MNDKSRYEVNKIKLHIRYLLILLLLIFFFFKEKMNQIKLSGHQ